MVTIPRLVIAAPASGQGKTSIATGLLAALRSRGHIVSPHKVGPDYIDPGYHALAAGRVGRNLDPWLVGEELIAPLFLHGALTPEPADLAIVEGVMGLFDGVADRPGFASTAHVAALLQAPVVLVVDGSATGRSVAALVAGFATFDRTVRIGGVIFNRVGSDRHEQILRDALTEVGVPVLGAVRRHDGLATPSRHLGLIPAAERSSVAQQTVDRLGDVVGMSVDMDALMNLARSAPPIADSPWSPATAIGDLQDAPVSNDLAPDAPVIAVAAGPAFTFSYAETTELLAAAGARVVCFDPTRDEELPDNTEGIVIGGGFPEIHAEALSKNVVLRNRISDAIGNGAAVAAECAGLLYLAQSLDSAEMCGAVAADAAMTPKLTIGYRRAVATQSSVLMTEGATVHGHEFHRTACEPTASRPAAWTWRANDQVVREGFVHGRIHASYLHLHWAGNPDIAQRFVAAAKGVQATKQLGLSANTTAAARLSFDETSVG